MVQLKALNSPSVSAHKKSLRQTFRKLRQTTSAEKALAAGQQALDLWLTHSIYQSAKKIAVFRSFDGEIDTTPLISQIWRDDKFCYLPKIRPSKPNRLWFLPYNRETKQSFNRFAIPEPDVPIHQAIRLSKLDLIIMPLVAFDYHGNRLGMGGGFYDATLAYLKNEKNRPLCIGYAYQAQHHDLIPTEANDFKLDGILTEAQLRLF